MLFRLSVDVDRDSVAMGDDMTSHAHTIRVPTGIRLSALLERAAPEIRSRGWSWVAVADRRPLAVWSVDHGVQLLGEDVRVTAASGPRSIHFRYFLQIDPAWLHRRLVEGARADRDALEIEYRPLAAAAWETAQRRRESEIPERLMSTELVGAILSLGAVVDLHNDRLLRFDLHGETWAVQRMDTMTSIRHGDDGAGASIRPVDFAECWLVAAVAAAARVSAGLPPVPACTLIPAPELRPMHDWPPGRPRWTTEGPLIARLSGEDAVDCYRLAFGRSVVEIVALMAPVAG